MKKLACDICGKKFDALATYGDGSINPTTREQWWICNDCFEKADALAEAEDRWPDGRDFTAVKATMT